MTSFTFRKFLEKTQYYFRSKKNKLLPYPHLSAQSDQFLSYKKAVIHENVTKNSSAFDQINKQPVSVSNFLSAISWISLIGENFVPD